MNSSICVWRSLVFQVVRRSHWWPLYLRMLKKGFSVVNKVTEKLVNNRMAKHLQKCSLFSNSQYGFTSSRSTVDLLTVVSDRIAKAFNRSGATWAAALDISEAFDRVSWHAGLLQKLLQSLSSQSLSEFQVRYLALILLFSVIDVFGWFWIGHLPSFPAKH